MRTPPDTTSRGIAEQQRSDALVFFGATGDLAYKEVFPALQGLVEQRRLDIPVIGVARSGWDLERLRARARDSLEQHGGVDPDAFAKLSSLLRYIDGDYPRPRHLHQAAAGAWRCQTAAALPGDPAQHVRDRHQGTGRLTQRSGRARGRGEAVRA